MKKDYIAPEIDIIVIGLADIISTSPVLDDDEEAPESNVGGGGGGGGVVTLPTDWWN